MKFLAVIALCVSLCSALYAQVLTVSENQTRSISGEEYFERIEIQGGATFTLYGSGKLSCNKLKVDGTFINHATVEIEKTDATFSGSGTFVQGEHAELITHAPTTPKLVASAVGNTVRLVRNGAITINCAEFYNLDCSTTYNLTKNFPTFSLTANTTIHGSLSFSRKCFLGLHHYSLTFPEWHEHLISAVFDTAGIIMGNGNVIVTTIPAHKTVLLPLFHTSNFSDFTHVEFTNNEGSATNFSIVGLEKRQPTVENYAIHHEIPHLPVQFTVESACNDATLRFYWHKDTHTQAFEPEKCAVIFLNGDTWEKYGNEEAAEASTHSTNSDILCTGTIYSSSAPAQSAVQLRSGTNATTFGISSNPTFLPVHLTIFSAQQHSNHSIITWKTASETNCDYFILKKSVDGAHFSPCAHILGNGNSSTPHSYSFVDTEVRNFTTYYQLEQYDYNGAVWKSKIISVNAAETARQGVLVWKNKTQCIIYSTTSAQCEIIDTYGRSIDTFWSNTTYDCSHLPQGVYFIKSEYFKISNNSFIK